jgi:hypothetical protein
VAQHKTASKSGGKGRASKRSTKKSGIPRASRSVAAPSASAGNDEVSIDRRRIAGRRSEEHECTDQRPEPAPQLERRKKVNRRRQIDPTTCERDYTEDEVQFMNALDEYKRKSGRMFPTCSEVLEVMLSLGYVKLPPGEFDALRGTSPSAASAKPMPSDHPTGGARPASIATDESTADGSSDLVNERQMAY